MTTRSQPSPHTDPCRSHRSRGSARRPPAIAWAPLCRLGGSLSVGAAALAVALHGVIDDRAIVTGVIVGASIVAWARVDPLRPARAPHPRR